jgi:hypothetical protein
VAIQRATSRYASMCSSTCSETAPSTSHQPLPRLDEGHRGTRSRGRENRPRTRPVEFADRIQLQGQELPRDVLVRDVPDLLQARPVVHRLGPWRPLRPRRQQRPDTAHRSLSTSHGRVLTRPTTATSSHRTRSTSAPTQDRVTSSDMGRMHSKHETLWPSLSGSPWYGRSISLCSPPRSGRLTRRTFRWLSAPPKLRVRASGRRSGRWPRRSRRPFPRAE